MTRRILSALAFTIGVVLVFIIAIADMARAGGGG